MGRLQEAAYNGRKEAYAYDLVGNRLKKETDDGTEFYSYNARNQLLQMEKGGKATHYHYDLQGNMLEEAGRDRRKYVYDALNRQANVAVDDFDQINRYDGEGLRYETEEHGKRTFYLFDRGELTAETNENKVGRYARGNDAVSEITDQEGNSEYFYYDDEGRQETHVDRNGNVERTLLLNSISYTMQTESLSSWKEGAYICCICANNAQAAKPTCLSEYEVFQFYENQLGGGHAFLIF